MLHIDHEIKRRLEFTNHLVFFQGSIIRLATTEPTSRSITVSTSSATSFPFTNSLLCDDTGVRTLTSSVFIVIIWQVVLIHSSISKSNIRSHYSPIVLTSVGGRDQFRGEGGGGGGGGGLLPEYFLHRLPENQVFLPEYDLLFLPENGN